MIHCVYLFCVYHAVCLRPRAEIYIQSWRVVQDQPILLRVFMMFALTFRGAAFENPKRCLMRQCVCSTVIDGLDCEIISSIMKEAQRTAGRSLNSLNRLIIKSAR